MPEPVFSIDELMADIEHINAQYDYWAEDYSKQNHGGINPFFVWEYVLHLNYDHQLSDLYSNIALSLQWPVNQAL